jgi:hypothetical protein
MKTSSWTFRESEIDPGSILIFNAFLRWILAFARMTLCSSFRTRTSGGDPESIVVFLDAAIAMNIA